MSGGWNPSADDFSKRNDRALGALKGVLTDIAEVTGKTPAVLVADAMKSVLIGGNKKPGLYQQGRVIRPDKGRIFSDMGGRFTAHGATFAVKDRSAGGLPSVYHKNAQKLALDRFNAAGARDKRGKPTSIFVRVTGHGDPGTVRFTHVRSTPTGKLTGNRKAKGNPVSGAYPGARVAGSTLGYQWRGKQAKLEGVVHMNILQYTLALDFMARRSSIGYYAKTFMPTSKDGSLNALRSVRRAGAGGTARATGQIRTRDSRGTKLTVDYMKRGAGGSYAYGKMLGVTVFNQDQHNPNRYASTVIEDVLEDRLNYFARKLKLSLSGLLGKHYGGTAWLDTGTGNTKLGEELGEILWPDPF